MSRKYTTKELVLYVAVSVVATLLVVLLVNVVTSALCYKPDVPSQERVFVLDKHYVPEVTSSGQ